jgi:hypothetical protein
MNPPSTIQKDSPAWIFCVWASFVIAIMFSILGIIYAPVNVWVRGYLAMSLLFTVAATFTLAKTVRDNHEAQRLINRVVDAKTEEILQKYELHKA